MHRALKYSLFLQREWTVLVESPTTSRDAGITALLPDGQIIQKDLFLEDFEFRWKKSPVAITINSNISAPLRKRAEQLFFTSDRTATGMEVGAGAETGMRGEEGRLSGSLISLFLFFIFFCKNSAVRFMVRIV